MLLLPSSAQLPGSDVDTKPKAKSSFTELLEVLTVFDFLWLHQVMQIFLLNLGQMLCPFSQLVLYAELHPCL